MPLQPRISKHALRTFKPRIAIFQIQIVNYNIITFQTFALIVLLLVDDVRLLLQHDDHELAEQFVHFFDFLIELVFYVELLFKIFRWDYSDSQFFGHVLNSDLLVMFERVQHWRIGETYLPLVLKNKVLLHQFALSALFEVKFAVALTVLVVSTHIPLLSTALLLLLFSIFRCTHRHFLPFLHILHHSRKTLGGQELPFSPFSCYVSYHLIQSPDFVTSAWFLVGLARGSCLDDSREVSVAVHAFFVGHLKEIGGGVVFDERTRIVSLATLAWLFYWFKCYVFLHALQDLAVLLTLEK